MQMPLPVITVNLGNLMPKTKTDSSLRTTLKRQLCAGWHNHLRINVTNDFVKLSTQQHGQPKITTYPRMCHGASPLNDGKGVTN